MGDLILRQGDQLPRNTKICYRDMGDGTHALVMALGGTAIEVVLPLFHTLPAHPTIYNLALAYANTEYQQVMPVDCRRFGFRCRSASDVRFAFVAGKVALSVESYMTLKAGEFCDSGRIDQGQSPSTLYFACSSSKRVMEILVWT